ncbi:MAG TPA: hypothetical protein VMJ64_10010 [Anaerolineales bacterium]|nr:hypothetical protein [Anaerolineales bacterium]
MGRYWIVFLLVGLAIGLWLGFNPAAHRDVARWWDRTTSKESASAVPGVASVQPLNRELSRLLRSAPRPQPTPNTQPNAVPAGPQISAELQALWNSLLRILNQIAARVSRPG